MERLKKSFKSLSHNNEATQQEDERQILLTSTTHNTDNPMTFSSSSSSPSLSPALDSSVRREVVIKIDGQESSSSSPSQTQKQTNIVSINENVMKTATAAAETNRVLRGSSYDFTHDPLTMLQKQDADVNVEKDFGFVKETPSPQMHSPLSGIAESPSYGEVSPGGEGLRVLSNESVRRRSNSGASGGEKDEVGEVLICSSHASFKRNSSFLGSKTKSRLTDPPEPEPNRSRMMRSGIVGKASEIDEDDPFLEEDLPEEYKKVKWFTPLSIFQTLSLILIIALLACTIAIKGLREYTVFDLELWKWEVMVLILICGRLVSGCGIRLAVFFIERNFLLRKRVLYFVYGLRNAVQNCLWLGLVLIAWKLIFDKRVEKVTDGKVLPFVTKIWVCLLVATFIWLVKTVLVKVLAMSFHVSTFFDRIQESLFNQYVIETLSGPPLVEIERENEEEERVMAEVQKLQNAGAKVPADLKANMFPKMIGTPRKSTTASNTKSPMFSRIMSKKGKEEAGITIDHLHRLNQKNISAWNMKRLMNIVRNGALSTLDEKLQKSAGEDESAIEITSENQAKVAAKKIFNNVAKPGSKYICLEDLMRFLGEEEALKTMRLFDGGIESKGISKRALKNWVVNVFRERRALALSLNDTKTAVNKLHQMLNVLVGVIIIVIWLLILKVATTHFFIFLSSQILLVVFIFGNTCKTTFEAIIFLFVMHPYDVGDRVEIDAVQMVVEEMNILTTVFLRYDNQKIIYPNSVLSTKPISNYYRSPDMGDAIDFCIHISTPVEKIAKMKEKITCYIQNKSEHWYPDPMIVMRDVIDLNRINWSVWLSHRMNFQDMGERWMRRALLVEEMIKIFRELDIEYRMLPVDMNLRNMPPLTSSRLPSNWTACA